jgi:hypothetical protein
MGALAIAGYGKSMSDDDERDERSVTHLDTRDGDRRFE